MDARQPVTLEEGDRYPLVPPKARIQLSMHHPANNHNYFTMRKVLFSGCSFTAECGFTDHHRTKYHWPCLLADKFHFSATNIAIGGASNREIFRRTIENIFSAQYDLVIVMWSSLSRHWVYYADNNVDDFTIINQGIPLGFNHNRSEVKLQAQNHFAYFDNQFMDLKDWLSMILALQQTLRSLNVPFIFIKGFDNYVNDFHAIDYHQGFTGPIDRIQHLVDFDNRPDYYIFEKISTIKNLIQKVDSTRWINWLSTDFCSMAVDRADDLEHPGPISNKLLFDKLLDHLNRPLS